MKRFIPLIFYTPPTIVLALLLYYQNLWFQHGLHITQGLHLLGVHTSSFVIVLACLVSASMVIGLQIGLQKTVPVLHLAISLLALFSFAILALPILEKAFSDGRDVAYGNIDCESLAADSRRLVHALNSSDNDYDWIVWDPRKESLVAYRDRQPVNEVEAPYLQSLHPIHIYVHPTRVVVQLEGGGIANHEGVVILLDANSRESESKVQISDLELLNDTFNVYRFSLYDASMLSPAE